MPKSKSRNAIKCKNCSLCEKVELFHKYNDISSLLTKVTKWDIENSNQFKQIKKYECLVCYFKTSIFSDWKCHIMSLSHLSDCHKIKHVYSYVCCNKQCKVVLYGSEKSLLQHVKNHEKKDANKQSNFVSLSGISNLMVEVMKRFGTEQKPLYFCSHCKKITENSLHGKNETTKSLKNPVAYYCKFCRVEFFSSPEMIDVHSLSVEHLTLKCFDMLCTTAKINSKKIKLSEPKFVQPTLSNENNLQPVFQKVRINNLVKLPMVVLNRFEKISPYKGECEFCKLIKCKLCNISVCWDSSKIISHLLNCEYKYDLTGLNKTSIKTFECNVCDYSTNLVHDHKMHMISYLHLTNCHDTSNLYSYFCNICNKFMYIHKTSIENHWKLHNMDNVITKMPILSTFMANILRDFNTNPNRSSFVHYYGDIKSNGFSKTISIVCFYCKIKFHTSVDDYNMHEMTSEHIILNFLNPTMYLMNDNSLTTKIEYTAMNKLIENLSLRQNSDHMQVIENNHLEIVQTNESQTNCDISYSELLDIVQKGQKIVENNVYTQELKNSSNCDNKKKLIPRQSKLQYTKYFNHKIEILNVLRQYKDRIIKTLSYYCIVCDFMTEEKYIWDNHNQMKHQDYSLPEIYCSSCSMIIVGPSTEEHKNTIEHCILLQFLNSLQLVENNLEKNTALINSIDNNALDETTCMNLDNNEELELKNEKISEEVLEFQCITNNVCKTNDSLLYEDDDKINSIKTSTSLNNDDQNFGHESNATTNLNEVFLENSQSKEDDQLKVSLFIDKTAASPDVPNVSNFHEEDNTVELNADDVYGGYVTQRLQLIENTTVKQDIKLEIDYLFYNKLKQCR